MNIRRSPTHENIGASLASGLNSYRSERIEVRRAESQDGRFGLSNTDTFQTLRPQLTRVRSYVYRNFRQLKMVKMRQVVHKIMIEIGLLAFLSYFTLAIRFQKPATPYGQGEQAQLVLLVYQFILILLGFTLFRVITIDYPTASIRFLKCLFILQIYQIFLLVHFLGKLF